MRDPTLWWIVAVGFAVRAACVALYPYLEGFGDQRTHYAMGVLAADVGPRILGQWGPVYDGLLAAIVAVLGPNPIWARSVQVLVSVASIVLVHRIAASAGGARAGRVAAWIWALYPASIAYSHYLHSETVFATLLLGAIAARFGAAGPPSLARTIAGGALFGLAALTRSVALYFLPLWLVWEWRRDGRAGLRAGLVTTVAALAVVLPWTARNAVRYDGLLLVDGTAGTTAWFAFNHTSFNRDLGFVDRTSSVRRRPRCPSEPLPDVAPLPRFDEQLALFPPPERSVIKSEKKLKLTLLAVNLMATTDLVRLQQCEVRAALGFVAERPGLVATHMLERIGHFAGPNGFLLRFVHEGAYDGGPLRSTHYPGVKWLVIASYVLVVSAAILALGMRDPPALGSWCRLFVPYYVGMHVLAVASSRYRFPLMPILAILGSVWLAHPRLPEGPLRRGAVATGLAGFLALSAYYVWTVLP